MVYMITATETSLLNLETNNFIEDEFYMNQIAEMEFEEVADEEQAREYVSDIMKRMTALKKSEQIAFVEEKRLRGITVKELFTQ